MLRTDLTSDDIDDVLAGTFPASHPPAWTPGLARLGRRTSSLTEERSSTPDIPEQTILCAFTP